MFTYIASFIIFLILSWLTISTFRISQRIARLEKILSAKPPFLYIFISNGLAKPY